MFECIFLGEQSKAAVEEARGRFSGGKLPSGSFSGKRFPPDGRKRSAARFAGVVSLVVSCLDTPSLPLHLDGRRLFLVALKSSSSFKSDVYWASSNLLRPSSYVSERLGKHKNNVKH